MKPVNNKILVRVDMAQKDTLNINGLVVSTALKFEKNYREKSPVIGKIVEGNEYLKNGSICVFHHNNFYPPSPYFLQDDLYSVPFNKTIFGVFDEEGTLSPICGNIFCERISIKTPFPLPIEQQNTYDKIYKVIKTGWTKYKENNIIFTRPSAGYDIVYNWNNIETRVTKVDSEQICGVVK